MKNIDKRLQKSLHKIINSIKEKTDGHQRELIKIIHQMKLSKDNEGLFFDLCMGI